MGRRGPKRTPTTIRILKGNPGGRPLNPGEPTPLPVADTQPPPDWLEDAAKVEWHRLAPLLARNGLLTELDLDALCAYCQAWCQWRTASDQLKKFGLVIKAPNGYPMASPYVPIAAAALRTMTGLMAAFGMTPSARSSVTRAVPPPAVNPLDKFINRIRR